MQNNLGWYQEIANAIILQAISDYRRALDGKIYGKINGKDKVRLTPEDIIEDCEKFFRSKYFQLLTTVNGEYLIKKLRKEHDEKVRKEQLCTLN